MSSIFFNIKEITVEITPESVLTQMGYPQENSATETISQKVKAELTRSSPLIHSRGAYLHIEQEDLPQGLDIFGPTEAMVLALATIGSTLETHAKCLINNSQPTAGFIADAIGTVAAEQTADYVENKIQQHSIELGWKISRRYAPGYCGWDIAEQRHLLGCFPDTIGIKLTDGCLMIPEKSLSFVCLLSKTGDFRSVKLGNCRKCRQKNCPYRLQAYEEKT